MGDDHGGAPLQAPLGVTAHAQLLIELHTQADQLRRLEREASGYRLQELARVLAMSGAPPYY